MCSNRFKMRLAYDGTAYAGWQMQPGAPTIQAALQDALLRLCGAEVKVHGSGRTDAGVHACGQVAHCDLVRPFPPDVILRALNAYLPPDIRILDAGVVHEHFHARKDAIAKEYRYFIWNAPILPPTERLYHLHAPMPLNVAAMQAAAGMLVGRHDFTAYTANPNRAVESTVRTIHALDVFAAHEQITLAVCGDGFLYKMVRSIAGWLIRVGKGDVSPQATAAVLASRARTASVPTAPPHGLFLWKVTYPDQDG